jgi:hypothetical protein
MGAASTGFDLWRLLAVMGLNVWSVLCSVAGALLLILIWHVIAGGGTVETH